MADTWLTAEEVQELTGRKRWTAQCRALAYMRIQFTPNAAGRHYRAKPARVKPVR